MFTHLIGISSKNVDVSNLQNQIDIIESDCVEFYWFYLIILFQL